MSNPTEIRCIILGAGAAPSLTAGEKPKARCLLTDPFGRRVMDWILSALRETGIRDIIFVGGFEIELIADYYPELAYVYSPDWGRCGILNSLYHARHEIRGPLLLSYADIVYEPDVCRALLACASGDICLGADASWRDRQSKALSADALRKNLMVLEGDRVRDIGFLPSETPDCSEFIGLAYFKPDAAGLVRDFLFEEYPRLKGAPFQQAPNVEMGYLTDLCRHLLAGGADLRAVEVGSQWEEMETPESLSRFVLGSKGQTLERFARMLTSAEFCPQIIVTVERWQADPQDVLAEVAGKFADRPIIVRSSSLLEDTWSSSQAGAFESVPNVAPADAEAVRGAINTVIASYRKAEQTDNPQNQVLIQEMVADVVMSGVVFTRNMNSGAPYYVINYDTGEQTDTVTSGAHAGLGTVMISRFSKSPVADARFRNVVDIVKELEDSSGCKALDIEFAVNSSGNVFILQVRPMTVVSSTEMFEDVSNEREMDSLRVFLHRRFDRQVGLPGETTLFSNMMDWNPAEMIGVRPRTLAWSLYEYLITHSAWRIARSRIGYYHPRSTDLMVILAGHPYIDARCSLNNLTPAGLNGDLHEKLVNYYLDRVRSNHDLHDKVEFEVCHTCMDFDFDVKTRTLLADGFSRSEVTELTGALTALTDRIVSGQVEPMDSLVASFERLNARRESSLRRVDGPADIPAAIGQFLDDCVYYGTISFSILARYGFIACTLLRSLVRTEILTGAEEQALFQSVRSVASTMTYDMLAVRYGEMPLAEFLSLYGHLRPGTYDIRSARYDESPEMYFSMPPVPRDRRRAGAPGGQFALSDRQRERVRRLIDEAGFHFSVDRMFDFMRKAIALREQGKFEFTKSVSEILRLLVDLGETYGITREAMSFVNIRTIKRAAVEADTRGMEVVLRESIDEGRRKFEAASRIHLPAVIESLADLDFVEFKDSRPNFVTLKKIIAPVCCVTSDMAPGELKGKIVVIEKADPGYDWLFAYEIAGLITKYGGAASHMAIRAAEFGIASAIGCGETIFNCVSRAQSVELDCSGERIHAL